MYYSKKLFKKPAFFRRAFYFYTMRPIGIFDSGYGGLTVLKSIKNSLPDYDYIYLGDNARAPYGTRSFETVYQYTWQAVQWLFQQNCQLVILACNTASAKALRNIQQLDLPAAYPDHRVLGVIRPTTEVIGNYSESKEVGIFATNGTVQSNSYILEIEKFFPEVKVYQQACPMWVPLIENNEHLQPGMDYFLKKYTDELLAKSDKIDTILLACTHYPLIMSSLKKILPYNIRVITQGPIVASSLVNYLQRHPEIESKLSKSGTIRFFSTDDESSFNKAASAFWEAGVEARQIHFM